MEATEERPDKVLRVCYICEGDGKAFYLVGGRMTCTACGGTGIRTEPTPDYFIG